jgi:hypothetical protein
MQARLSWLLCALFQVALSSPTHGPTKRPSRIHRLSVVVSVMEIFSTSYLSGRPKRNLANRPFTICVPAVPRPPAQLCASHSP